jgi:hypothetical protein
MPSPWAAARIFDGIDTPLSDAGWLRAEIAATRASVMKRVASRAWRQI